MRRGLEGAELRAPRRGEEGGVGGPPGSRSQARLIRRELAASGLFLGQVSLEAVREHGGHRPPARTLDLGHSHLVESGREIDSTL